MTDESFKRKLTAILSADVKDYSRLMDDDEKFIAIMQDVRKRLMYTSSFFKD